MEPSQTELSQKGKKTLRDFKKAFDLHAKNDKKIEGMIKGIPEELQGAAAMLKVMGDLLQKQSGGS